MRKIKQRSAVLYVQIEDIEGTSQALTAQDALLVTNLEATIGEGDSSQTQYADGYDVPFDPEEVDHDKNTFTFNAPVTFSPDPAVLSPIIRLFRMAGFDVVHDAATHTTVCTATRGEAIDSGTLSLRRKKVADDGTTSSLEYPTNGAKCQLGIELTKGGLLQLNVTAVGNYLRPDEVPLLAADYGVQKSSLAYKLNPKYIRTMTLGGHSLCLEKLNCENLGGLTIDKTAYITCSKVEGEPITPTGSLTYLEKDWTADFNPYEKAESNSVTQTMPLVIDYFDPRGYSFKLEWSAVQLGMPKEVSVGKGDLGKEQPLHFLSNCVVTMKKEAV